MKTNVPCRCRRSRINVALSGMLLVLSVLLGQPAPAYAQLIPCPDPIDLSKQKLPEIVTDGVRLRAEIVLSDAQQAYQIGLGKCVPQLLRFFQNDVVELTFLDQIDPLDYGNSIDRWENLTGDPSVPGAGCDSSSSGYPQLSAGPPPIYDTMPDCFHGSSTGNLHFHGTHTSPQSTADDVFIGVRPSPRVDGKPVVTAESVKPAFDAFFAKCEQILKADNLAEWPRVWADLPTAYTQTQEALLKAYDQGKPPETQLWPVDERDIKAGQWPQYYIGAFPNCFIIPKYPGVVPAHPDMRPMRLHMGQAPGTHWYHAHKHGSTFLNVSNGMAGAFIIEGDDYDGRLNGFYSRYRSHKSTDWTRQQPTMVVNQLDNSPGLERGGGIGAAPFSINGQQQPIMTMYPGEVKLWRIVNASPTSGFYLPALPAGFTWRQTAQDGVQFDDRNYQERAQRPVFVAPGNRVDLLVRAPTTTPAPGPSPVTVVQGVSVSAAEQATPNVILLAIVLAGSGPVMPLMPHAPPRPVFLHDISSAEVAGHTRTVTFATIGKVRVRQHTVDGHKFQEGPALEINPLNTVEEWTVKNETVGAKIDHPFHIHLNPFQITEVFDPNAPLLDSHGVPVKGPDGTFVPLYVIQTARPTLKSGQCWLNPDDSATWKPCNSSPQTTYPGKNTNIWWDVFPIPAGVAATTTGGQTVTIAGYFKMRSRFVDYPGSYVLHCHILAHEDRGMMVQVNLAVNNAVPLQHH